MKSVLFLSICVFFLLLLAGNIQLIQAEEEHDSNATFLRLPGSEVAAAAAASAPTNIIGRDGLCLDVTNNTYADGTPIQLWPCNSRPNQLWTFESDGTIRSNGKCLTTSWDGATVSYAMIYECYEYRPPACATLRPQALWSFNYLGTITNNFSGGLVLSSMNASTAQGLPLTLAKDDKLPFQAWTAVNYTIPVVNYIIGGPNGYCLNADNYLNPNDYVRVRCCQIRVLPRQQWAVYGDRTIRFFGNQSLCVTSWGITTASYIGLRPCQGLRTQRWNFVSNAQILNPYTDFYLNVYGEVELNIIAPTLTPRQQWYTLPCPDCPPIAL